MDPSDIETQKALDAHIEQLESELADLKRRRNALSPVSRLPPEILCNILLLVRQQDLDVKDKKFVPQYLRLCHVSHFWRMTMLGYPKFWVDIRLTSSMPGQGWRMLKSMARYVKNHKISVTYAHDRYWANAQDSVGQLELNLLHTLHEESSKIKSLSLVWKRPGSTDEEEFAKIFSGAEYNNLEALRLEATSPGESLKLGLGKIFKNRPPMLQRIEVDGWMVQLPSSLQQLQGMTHLVFNGGLAGNLFELLSSSPRLRTLHISKWESQHPRDLQTSNTSENIVQLPYLESFALSSVLSEVLLSILKDVRIPPDLAHLNFGRVPFSKREFFDIWKQAQVGIIEPQHLLIGRVGARGVEICSIHGWKTTVPADQFQPQRLRRSPPSVTLKLLPASLAPTPPPGSPRIDDIYLFSEPQDYQHKWTFAEVKVMELLVYADEGDPDKSRSRKYTIGPQLRATIASAPRLQLLHLDSRFEDKFREIFVTLGQHAFPALQHLIFSFVRHETNSRRISFDRFTASILEYFKPNRRTALVLLGFRHCPGKVNQGTLDALKEVAVNVVFSETGEWL